MKISSYSQLQKVLNQAIKDALKDTGDKTTNLVKEHINTDVYDAGSPVEYDRTFQLRESVKPSDVKTKGNIAEVIISHDTSLIIPNPEKNQHASALTGESSAEYIPEIVHEGEAGAIFGEGFWTTKRPYMSNTKEELEKGEYKKFVKESLEKQGISTR